MVANPERGEVPLVVKRGDEEREYVLKLTMTAAAALQKRLGKTLGEALEDLAKMDVVTIMNLAFMLLQKHHKDEIKTVDQAGELIDDSGRMSAFIVAFNKVMEINTTEGTGNPLTAQTAGGAPSTSAPDAPA